jgi:phosphate:Na+ symporter
MTDTGGVLLNLAGGVALLLWGARMVRTGVVRAWGDRLRLRLKTLARSGLRATAAGLGATVLLQSSTATALILAGLAGSGFIPPAAGLAALLGADLGSALVAALMAVAGVHASIAPPLLIFAGYLAFSFATRFRPRNFGRILMGLGLMFLALQMIVAATEPLRDAPLFRSVVAAVGGDPVTALATGAAAAWASHSSIAVLLVVASLAASDVLSAEAGLLLVLGINLGAGVPALIGTLGLPAAARRLPLTNLACRAFLALLLAPFASTLAEALPVLALPGPAAAIAGAHIAFNLALVTALSPFSRPIMAAAHRLLPDRPQPFDPFLAPRYLDPAALATPAVALSNAATEAARMSEVLDRMLGIALDALTSRQAEPLKALSDLDDRLSLYRTGIHAYLIELRKRPLQSVDEARITEALLFVSNLEHAGSIVAGPMRDHLRAAAKADVRFTHAQMTSLVRLVAHVRASLARAVAVFASHDVEGACQLIQRKTGFREMEREIIRGELSSVDRPAADDAGRLFIDIVRELHKVHSQAISVANPIAEAAGVLRISRLSEHARARRGTA